MAHINANNICTSVLLKQRSLDIIIICNPGFFCGMPLTNISSWLVGDVVRGSADVAGSILGLGLNPRL